MVGGGGGGGDGGWWWWWWCSGSAKSVTYRQVYDFEVATYVSSYKKQGGCTPGGLSTPGHHREGTVHGHCQGWVSRRKDLFPKGISQRNVNRTANAKDASRKDIFRSARGPDICFTLSETYPNMVRNWIRQLPLNLEPALAQTSPTLDRGRRWKRFIILLNEWHVVLAESPHGPHSRFHLVIYPYR